MDAISAAARPWIEAAKPSYPCLIDLDHRVADLYHMVNVPQAVWIDETGHIVRPTESAGAYEGFRAMDRATRKVPDEVAATTSRAKRTYVDADPRLGDPGAGEYPRLPPPEAPSPIWPCLTTAWRGRTRTSAWDSTCSGAARKPPRADTVRRGPPPAPGLVEHLAADGGGRRAWAGGRSGVLGARRRSARAAGTTRPWTWRACPTDRGRPSAGCRALSAAPRRPPLGLRAAVRRGPGCG